MTDELIIQDLKKKVEAIVNAYKFNYKAEFDLFVKQNQMMVKNQRTSFAETKGTDVLRRQIYVVPENLDIIFTKILTPEEYQLFKDNIPEFKKNPEDKKMSIWFAKRFPEFMAGTKV